LIVSRYIKILNIYLDNKMDKDVLLETKETINTFISTIIDSRIKSILETISLNYPAKFSKILIDKEFEYIKKHIIIEKSNKINTINANDETIDEKIDEKIVKKHIIKKKLIKIKHIHINKHKVKKKIINIEEQCTGRVWNDFIFSKQNMKKINDIESKYKVLHYKDIDLKSFTDKYLIGSRCSKSKLKDSKYCKLHSNHLIHGDYLEIPSKELCYHFIKDGKYL